MMALNSKELPLPLFYYHSLYYSIGDLGSGSDHTGFYHRHGITSMDVVYYYDKVSSHTYK